MKRNRIILAVVAIGLTVVAFKFLFSEGKLTSEAEVDLQPEEQTGPVLNAEDKEKHLIEALRILGPNTNLEHIEQDLKSLSDPEILTRYIEAAASDRWVASYFKALQAIDANDTGALKVHYDLILADDIKEDEQQYVITLLEDINIRGAEQGVREIWCRNNLGQIYRVTGQVMMAVPQLRKVLELDSNNIPAIYMLAEMAVQSGQLQKAKERFKKLVSLQPQNQNFRSSLIAICEELKDSECVTTYSASN